MEWHEILRGLIYLIIIIVIISYIKKRRDKKKGKKNNKKTTSYKKQSYSKNHSYTRPVTSERRSTSSSYYSSRSMYSGRGYDYEDENDYESSNENEEEEFKINFSEYDLSSIIRNLETCKSKCSDASNNTHEVKQKLYRTLKFTRMHESDIDNIKNEIEESIKLLEDIKYVLFGYTNKTVSEKKKAITLIEKVISKIDNFNIEYDVIYQQRDAIKDIEEQISSEEWERDYTPKKDRYETSCHECWADMKYYGQDFICIECKKKYIGYLKDNINDLEEVESTISDCINDLNDMK